MKYSFRNPFILFSFFAFILACTKEVTLKTEVEFDLAVEHNAKGYVNDELSTTVTVVPEEVLEELSYSYSYSISKGEGHFTDRSGAVLPQGDRISLDSFSAAMQYVGAKAGEHVIKVIASDSYGFTEDIDIEYTIDEIPPAVWTATSSVNRIEMGKSAMITVQFEKSEANADMDYVRRYRITSGSGELTEAPEQGEVGLDEFEAIAPGTYTLNFTPFELGTAVLSFDLKGDDGEVFTAKIAFEVVEDVPDTEEPKISITLLGNDPQQILLNAAYTESGATALDSSGGDLTEQIDIDASAVDTSQEGSYEVTYTVTDGDETATATRTVIVTNTVTDVAVTGIDVLPETANVVAGGTQQLTTAVTPDSATDKGVLWSSNNTATATVDANGLVTAISAGDAVITATSADNASITDTSVITVAPSQVLVTTIAVNSSRASIPDNETEQFTAVVGPINATNAEVTWSSGNTGVATVDLTTGLVTAVSAGTANITATATDGSGVTGSKEIAVTATVTEIRVTTITVTRDRSSIADNETEPFTAIVAPSNATNTNITWSSSNPGVAPVNVATGMVTAVSAGTTTIEAKATDGSNVTDSAGLTVTVSTIEVTGITVSSDRTSIRDDETENFSASVTPANASNSNVTWSSSNTAVAMVNAGTGVVTAVSAGTVNIVATAADGSGVSGSEVLTVTANRAPTALATSNATSGTAPLAVSFAGSGSSDPDAGDALSYSWDFGDGSAISTQADPLHTFSNAGLYTVTLTVTDGSLSDTDTINIGIITPSNPDFSFSVGKNSPEPPDGYGFGESVDLNFAISPNSDMPSGANYIMRMTTQKALLEINGGNYRENRDIPMNSGSATGIFQNLTPSQSSVSVTFTVTETLTGISKSRTLTINYCTGNNCML